MSNAKILTYFAFHMLNVPFHFVVTFFLSPNLYTRVLLQCCNKGALQLARSNGVRNL